MPRTLVFQPSSGKRSSIGQVLEGGGVEDDLRGEPAEDRADGVLVADVAQHRVVGVEQSVAVEGELRRVQGRLVAVEQDELGRAELADLAGELGADGATSAGDEDDLAGDVLGDLGEVGLDRAAAEEVGDVEGAQLVELDPARDHLAQRRHDDELEPRLGAAVGRPAG